MEDHHPEISENRLFFFEQEKVLVEGLDSADLILDIGGGGEGIIGRLMGKQVIAIDPSRRELEEAAPGPLKIVMDAADLQFLDESFNTVTAFYTLMYIKDMETQRKVFSEVYRVLSTGGRYLIWDAIVLDSSAEITLFLLAMFKI